MEEIVSDLYPGGVRLKKDWCVGDVHGNPSHKGEGVAGSFRISLTGGNEGWGKEFNGGDKAIDLIEMYAVKKGLSRQESALLLAKQINSSQIHNFNQKQLPSKPRITPIMTSYMARLRNRLHKSDEGLNYLQKVREIDIFTLDFFALGLSEPYQNKGVNGKTENALVCPLISYETGELTNKSVYYDIEGVTKNPPKGARSWCKGGVFVYWGGKYEGQRSLFVCEGIKDIWMVWQQIRGTPLEKEIYLASSTHGCNTPEAWKHPSFWQKWDKVYFGSDSDNAGEKFARNTAEMSGKELLRVRVPSNIKGKDWTDFFINGGSIDLFAMLLMDAKAVYIPPPAGGKSTTPDKNGLRWHQPVHINGAYHEGKLHYVTQVEKWEKVLVKDQEGNEKPQMQGRKEVIVIRSDKQQLFASYVPCPPKTPIEEKIAMLNDGTIITEIPQANTNPTWRWPSIQRYINGKADTRPLKLLLKELIEYIRTEAWLPYKNDYTVIALAVITSYVQEVFDAVPYLLLNGPTGSGKSQIGGALFLIGPNPVAHAGSATAAQTSRSVHSARGICILDDLEVIGGKDNDFGQLIQGLKIGYKKSTGTQKWIDASKGFSIRDLRVYGVKVINNTSGVDDILGSRMVRVQTRLMPKGVQEDFANLETIDVARLPDLRDELHCWAFESCKKVEAYYRENYSSKTDRDAEIFAPLWTLAHLSGDQSVIDALTEVEERHKADESMSDDPLKAMEIAVRNIIEQGYEWFSIAQLKLEMKRLLPFNSGVERTTDIPSFLQENWLSRQLRTHD